MSESLNAKFLDDPEFQSLLVGCMESLERGETIDRDALARDFPRFAGVIGQFLDDRILLEKVASGFGDVDPSRVAISAYEQTLASGTGADDFTVGDTVRYIGEYEILEEIARGGMGVVFKARQQKLNRIVALKMILAGRLAGSTDVERFQREARAAGKLKHPGIVPVHEIGEHGSRHYFTMDYVEGRSLAEAIREETLAPRAAAKLVLTAAEAVQYAHVQGIVHRDLKPANILLDKNSQPQVTDFGLARMLEAVDEESRAELTASGQILGTPSYMSPEQASGKQDLVGPASDIYSLGAILYASLTGRAPFVADSPVDTLLQVMKKEPVSPRDLNPSVPRDLETICLKCLTKEPHKRYGTAQELADDLCRFLEGRPVVARPVGPISRYSRWCRRNPWVASLATLSVLLLLTGTAVSTYFAIEADHQAAAEKESRDRADREAEAATLAKTGTEAALAREASARTEAEAARDAEVAARQDAEKSLANEQAARKLVLQREREAKWNEYVARMTVIQRPWQDREYGHLTRMVDQLRPEEGEPDFRGWEWSYYANLVEQASHRIPNDEEIRRGSWSSDGKRFTTAGRRLQVFDAETMLPIVSQEMRPWLTNAIFDPNGSTVVVGFTDGQIGLFDIEDQVMLGQWKAHDRGADYLSFSPDGQQLASGSLDGSSAIWDVQSGEQIHQLTPARKNIYLRNVDWHPSEPLVVIADRSGYVRVFDSATGKQNFSRRACGISCSIGLWSPDGEKLAGGGSFPNYEILFYSPTGDGHGSIDAQATCGAWSPDGKTFATGSDDQDVKIRDVDTGQVIQTTRFHSAPMHHIDWSPDGESILSVDSDGNGRVWKVRPDIPDAKTIHQDDLDVRVVRYSFDGKWIAGACIDGHIRIWSAETGEPIATSHELSSAAKDVTWSPDAKQLITICDDNKVWLWDRQTGETRQPFESGLSAGGVHVWIDWRPGTNQIAIGEYQDDTHVFDLDTGNRINTSSMRGGFARWSPSGNRLALVDKIVDSSLQLVKQTNLSSQNVFRTEWSPNGRLLASAMADGTIVVLDLLSSDPPQIARGHRHFLSALAWHPSGTRIATGDHDGVLKLWDAATLDEVWSTKLPHRVLSLAWSPDGRQLVSSDGVDVSSYPTRKKEGDVYSVRIWGTRDPGLIEDRPEMLSTQLARALAPGNDRPAAETALRVGGTITISTQAEKVAVDRVADLPQSAVQILALDLHGIGEVNDEILSRLHSLDSIQQINLRHTHVSDDAVRAMMQSIARADLIDFNASHREFHIQDSGSIAAILAPNEELAQLTSSIAEKPEDGDRLVARARWFAKHLRWNDALADLESYLKLSPRNSWMHCEAAAAALMCDDMESYRRHLMVNLDKMPDLDFSREPSTGAYLAELAAAVPDAVDDVEILRSLANRHGKVDLAKPYEAISLAMLEHRLDNYERVLEILEPHVRRGGHYYSELILADSLRAFALHQLARNQEAETAFAKALRTAEQAWPEAGPDNVPTYGDLKHFVLAKQILEETRAEMNPSNKDGK